MGREYDLGPNRPLGMRDRPRLAACLDADQFLARPMATKLAGLRIGQDGDEQQESKGPVGRDAADGRSSMTASAGGVARVDRRRVEKKVLEIVPESSAHRPHRRRS